MEPTPVPFGPPGATPGTQFVFGEGRNRMEPSDKFNKLADGKRVFVYDPNAQLPKGLAEQLTAEQLTAAMKSMMKSMMSSGSCKGVECAGVGTRTEDTVGDQALLALAFATGTDPGKDGVSGGMAGGVGKKEDASGAKQAVAGGAHLIVALLGQAVKAYRAVKGLQEGLRALHAPRAPTAGAPQRGGRGRFKTGDDVVDQADGLAEHRDRLPPLHRAEEGQKVKDAINRQDKSQQRLKNRLNRYDPEDWE